ncbi:heterokaryon incompatibility protein-domain-containing protein [Staphylotrichum tortipilum]|uniref:Heterokaryon incompatibility protein-domain-containing protein n=1 Tax=Staphylotrichum tortipilum TaxID=2831512 RepID=A0AAN6RN72_9PEZI|nr:heterokaryon incompatibility protein-domain-containing protein [Staphylotrichum longicolle]
MPCQICNDFKGSGGILEKGKTVGLGTGTHRKVGLRWNEITASAESCFTCDILTRGIRGSLQQHSIQESDIQSVTILFYYGGESGDEADTNKELRFHLADGSRFDMELFITEEEPDSVFPSGWGTFPISQRTSPRTDSNASLAAIQGWIEECLGPSHEFCYAATKAELPARVIDVGIGNSTIRLVEPPRGTVDRYICLSHCWGREQIITTTTLTMKDRVAGIKMGDLSKTFQDAVALTRRLGVRYIWIDSLCILQDDRRDWEVQSAQMCDIYSKAYLTIAATHSRDGRGGLFHETPDFEVSGVAPGPGGGNYYRIFFRERIDHHLDCTNVAITQVGHTTITHHPILTRAWVYQERMLSTRVLQFGRYEVFFECRSVVACECDGIEFHGSSAAAPVAVTKLVHADALDSELPGVDWAEYAHYYIARLWRTMVSSYTALDITFHGDRLPAMGGLAKHMAARRRSAYRAGLWEDSLLDDLLWLPGGSSISKRPRPVPRAAPTWSWASTEHFVLYNDTIMFWDPDNEEPLDREPYQHFAKVEECVVVPGGVDEFGMIPQGRLQISGQVATGILERAAEVGEGQQSLVYHVVFPGGVKMKVYEDYRLEEPGEDQVLPGAEVKCLRMGWIQMQAGSDREFFSLVLRPVGGAPAVYERIGCICILMRAGGLAEPSPVDPFEPVYRSAVEQTVVIV